MLPDDDWILISAIEHYGYCPRQCALIHVEQIFDENVFTLRGRRAHERVDTAGYQTGGQDQVRLERALPLWCERLGLIGKADAVEMHPDGRVVPVEYKSGPSPEGPAAKRRSRQGIRPEDLQLCAQAICLEEMLDRPVPVGSVYHVATRRRREVPLGSELRAQVEAMVALIRDDLRAGHTPPPVNDARCPNCSLVDACVPAVIAEARMAWHLRDLFRAEEG